LDASEGKPVDKSQAEKPLYLRVPVSEMSFMKNCTLPPTSLEEQIESINIAAELLSSNRSDSNMLGMEMLVSLTDSSKTLKSTAVMASERILSPEDDGNKSFNLHNYVMSLVIYGNDSDEKSFLEGTAVEGHHTKLRNLAISSLSNALELLLKEGVLSRAMESSWGWYCDVLIPRLVQDLATSSEHPHDACYASRCISSLVSSSYDFAEKVKKVGGLSALESAEEVGHNEFALLAQDAGRCHKSILQSCG
jgi:hypothetical protein